MPAPDRQLLDGLRAGDEGLFRGLVEELSPVLLRLARNYTRTPAAAQDAVQDSWLVVLEGLPRFEGRSSLKTWVCGIVINKARARGVEESRVLPRDLRGREPAVDPGRFDPVDGSWLVPPVRWDQEPEAHLGSNELLGVIDAAIAQLPLRQRELITVRDVLGMGSEEAAALLRLSSGNQRVLLHRARSRVRAAVEAYAEQHLARPERRRTP